MRAKVSIFLLAFIFFVSGLQSTAFSQALSVYGKVTDEQGNPIEQAIVFVTEDTLSDDAAQPSALMMSSGMIDRTNREGEYRINQVQPGRYLISAYFSGKQVLSKRVAVRDSDREIDFRLQMLSHELSEITVGNRSSHSFGITRLNAVEGVAINEAKKNEVVLVENIAANLATNNGRQVFAKVAGLNIWENSSAGVQLNIGGRGLNPNRTSNFNTRQNGYDIAADALGYPESYYTPPIRALERIEIIRGAASLQYGTQFGGLLNFIFKDGPSKIDPFRLNTYQSVGSHGMLTSYNSIGGNTDDINYYGFYQYKKSDGWRPNSEVDQHTGYLSFQFKLNDKLSITPEFTHMNYLAHQPGGLTDAQFRNDPQQSTRERNWFLVNWNLLALKADYLFSPRSRLNTRFFGLRAGRDAVGNLGRIDRIDFGGERDLLKDDYNNWGNETRFIHRYPLLGNISVFLLGTRYYSGFTHRRQGNGSSASDPDFSFLNPENLRGSDFDLPSKNISVFAENVFNITPQFSLTPGLRFEYINTEADGYYRNIVRDLAGNILQDERIEEQRSRERSFLFYGIGASYKSEESLEVYANFSQNYRAINFNDIRVDIGSLEVDPQIQDERGFNIDLGFRGTMGNLFTYDLSLFHLSYEDRIGTILKTEPNPNFNGLIDRTFRYRTNIADANIYGIETFAELDFLSLMVPGSDDRSLSLFSNLALIQSEYVNSDISGIEGNEVELVPKVNFKTGLTYRHDQFKATYQLSYVSQQFSDASNARSTPTAIEGIIPAYYVMDVSAEYQTGIFRFEAGVNNLTDHRYFTRRATGYPGPGIIPAEARSLYVTLGLSL